MRKRWIQVRTEHGPELVPADQYTYQQEAHKGPFILGDIKPYVAVTGDMQGKWITSRSQHRAFLQRNNLIEVGNEKDYFTRHGGMTPDNPNLLPERKQEERVCQSLMQTLHKLQSR